MGSNTITLYEGDRINFTFQIKTVDNQPGPVFNKSVAVRIFDGTNFYTLGNDGRWTQGGLWNVEYPIGDNTNEWHTVVVEGTIPFKSIFQVFLPNFDFDIPYNESHIKDIRFTLQYNINGYTKLVGHSHIMNNLGNIKNIEEKEIFIDNTERGSINGTLNLETFDGIFRNLCSTWKMIRGFQNSIQTTFYYYQDGVVDGIGYSLLSPFVPIDVDVNSTVVLSNFGSANGTYTVSYSKEINGTFYIFMNEPVPNFGTVNDAIVSYTMANKIYPKLGMLTTKERLYAQFQPRGKFDGNFLFMIDGPTNRILSNFCMLTNTTNKYGTNNFMIPGAMSIDYKNNNVKFTIWDLVSNYDISSRDLWYKYDLFDRERIYEFLYLYDKA
jgi:hypothetical protein